MPDRLTHLLRLRCVLAGVCAVLLGALGACDAGPDAPVGPVFPRDLVSPSSRVLDGPVRLQWQPLADSGRYEVEIARELAGRLDTVRTAVAAPSYTADLGPGAYRWRVRGFRFGAPTAWSPESAFWIDRAEARFAVRWQLPTGTWTPSSTYIVEAIAPITFQTRLAELNLNPALVRYPVLEDLGVTVLEPVGTPLDILADYQLFPAAGGVIGSLLEPPAASSAPMQLSNPGLSLQTLNGPVRYRLRTATTTMLPEASTVTVEMSGDVTLLLDVRTPFPG